ncbi:MAG: hypothetical protein U0931_09165 [Vulcanimicrobiota bacterium]
MKCFLVENGSLWTELPAHPLYVGEHKTAPYSFPIAWFSAAAHADGCRIKWLNYRQSSPLPEGKEQVILHLGQSFQVADRIFMAYLEPEEWTEAPGSGPDSCGNIDCSENLWRAYLELPYTSAWYREAYRERTGFVQLRNGVVPKVRSCSPQVSQGGVLLHFEVGLYDLIDEGWTDEHPSSSFERRVRGQELEHFNACLRHIPDFGR